IKETLNQMPWPAVSQVSELLFQAWSRQKHVFIMGNGGSAATAIHMAADLAKNTATPGHPRLRAISLCENIATFSAYANDVGYENVFQEQVLTYADPGDLVIAISGSGNSPNVLKAIRAARMVGATSVGLTGMGGGKLADMVDVAVVVPNHNIEQVEDLHMIFVHSITSAVRNQLHTAAKRAA
ncbi:MAG: D-sedoheptulose-7-phosphate isomerase, partial [Caldilineaceae bacterium]